MAKIKLYIDYLRASQAEQEALRQISAANELKRRLRKDVQELITQAKTPKDLKDILVSLGFQEEADKLYSEEMNDRVRFYVKSVIEEHTPIFHAVSF